MNKQKFSVLMSLYIKENPRYFCQCMESIIHQTAMPDEIVIIKDGPLTQELENVLKYYQEKDPQRYKIIALKENKGLGLALAEGVRQCSYSLIARMDTDDLSVKYRFEKQLKEFEKDPDLDICGSHIKEFDKTPKQIVAKRIVPLSDAEIKKYQKKRDGLNHVSVMFKKDAVLRAGNYQHALLMEDSLLWVNMFKTGAKAKNIDDFLVYVRTGKDMIQRRGGWEYFKKYKSGRRKIYETGYITWWDYMSTLIIQLIVSLIPTSLREIVFNKMLRR